MPKVILSVVVELGFELGDSGSELLTAKLSAYYSKSTKKECCIPPKGETAF